MTTRAAKPAAPAPGLLRHPVEHMRSRLPPPIVMPNGKPARARLLQSTLWALIVALLAAALIAGIYFNVLQVNWHVFWLKAWWDGTAPYHGGMGGLIRSANWSLYRHGYRDKGEPEMAILVVGTLIAKRKAWSRRAPLWYMAVAPLLLIALSALGITGLVWLLDVGIPHWAGGQLSSSWLTTGTVSGGFLLGHVLRPVWTPVGATLNGWFIDWSVDRYLVRRRNNPGKIIKAPAWVRHWYLAPLQLRERWMWQVRNNEVITRHRHLPLWLIWGIAAAGILFMLLVAYLVLTGLIAHFWIGSGHSFPFLAPPGQ